MLVHKECHAINVIMHSLKFCPSAIYILRLIWPLIDFKSTLITCVKYQNAMKEKKT